jgi:hypothetical protein
VSTDINIYILNDTQQDATRKDEVINTAHQVQGMVQAWKMLHLVGKFDTFWGA